MRSSQALSIARRVAFGTAQLTLSNVFVRVLSLVTMPVLTRLLAPSAYGTAAMATTLISLISVFALAGADISYIRAYHSEKPPCGQAVEALTWRFSLGASMLAAILLAACWSLISDALLLPRYTGPLIAAGIVLSVGMTMALARARLHDRHRAMSLATVASGLGATGIAIAVAYSGQRNEFPLILALLATYLIPIFVLGLPPLPELLHSSGLSYESRKHILGIGLAAIVSAPAYWVMSSSDRWFLSHFQNLTAVGVYSISCGVAIAGMTVNSALLAIWTPEAARLFEARPPDAMHQLGRITEGMVAVLACVWLAVTAAGGDMVRLLTAPAFHGGANVIPFIAGGVFFHGISHLANTAFVLDKRLNRTIIWWVGGAAANLMLNLLLVPEIGMMGAGVSQLLSFAVTALGLSMGARRMLAAHIKWTRLLLVVTTIVIAALFMFPAWAKLPAISLIMKLPVGLFVTAIVISYFRNDFAALGGGKKVVSLHKA